MHLLNTKTLELEAFEDGKVPPYAIVSHRWGKDELHFIEIRKKRVNKQKQGYIKMAAACRIAMTDFGLKYLWIDTCCINKRSSAELSEAVNSMYRWYQNAVVCIVYLCDIAEVADDPHSEMAPQSGTTHQSVTVPQSGMVSQPEPSPSKSTPNASVENGIVPFHQSQWFTRAWTLQELLAPINLHFYNFEWKQLGEKDSLLRHLEKATGIPSSALAGKKKLTEFAIAEKMCWASRRSATRVEDLAYSLMGLFDINMLVIYGEGPKAFVRLQEEIIKQASDHSFLFWGIGSDSNRLLATSPAEFAKARLVDASVLGKHTPVALNNIGLDVTLELTYWSWQVYGVEYWINNEREWCVLLLRIDSALQHLYRIGTVKIPEGKAREFVDVEPLNVERRKRTVTVLRNPPLRDKFSISRQPLFCGVQIGDCSSASVKPHHQIESPNQRLGVWESDSTTGQDRCRFKPPTSWHVARMKCESQSSSLSVDFCIDFDFNVYVYVKPYAASDIKPSEKRLQGESLPEDDLGYDITTIKEWRALEWTDDTDAHGVQSAIVDRTNVEGYVKGWICRLVVRGGNFGGPLGASFDLPSYLLQDDLEQLTVHLVPPLHSSFGAINPCWILSINSTYTAKE